MFVDFNTDTWAKGWMQKLPLEAKLLYVYLYTSPTVNQPALYHITLRTITHDTGIPEARLVALLRRLAPQVMWDAAAEVVWIVDHARDQFFKNGVISEQVAKGLIKNLNVVGEHPFVSEFFTRYPLMTVYRGSNRPSETPQNRGSIDPPGGEGRGRVFISGKGLQRENQNNPASADVCTTIPELTEVDFAALFARWSPVNETLTLDTVRARYYDARAWLTKQGGNPTRADLMAAVNSFLNPQRQRPQVVGRAAGNGAAARAIGAEKYTDPNRLRD